MGKNSVLNGNHGDVEYQIRSSRLVVLKELHWLEIFPQGVDMVLEYAGKLEVADYIRGKRFLRDCLTRYSSYGEIYHLELWDSEAFIKGQLANGEFFVDLLADKFIGQLHRESLLHGGQTLGLHQDELRSQFRDQILHSAHKFSVGRFSQGKFISHGFEAYLTENAYRNGRRKIFKEILQSSSSVALEESFHRTLLVETSAEVDYGRQRQRILESLRSILSEPGLWRLFYDFIYSQETTRSLSAKLGLSNGTVSYRLTGVFDQLAAQLASARPQASAALPKNGKRLSAFARAWRDCFEEQEFLESIPRPL